MRCAASSAAGSSEARSRSGITKIEVAIMILCGVSVFSLLIPWIAWQRISPAAPQRLTECRNRLKSLGLALHNNHDVDRFFPPGSTSRASWPAYILPFLDQNPIYQTIDPRNGVAATSNGTPVSNFVCPQNDAAKRLDGRLTYLGSGGVESPSGPAESAQRGVFRDESYDKNGFPKTNVTDPGAETYRGWSFRGNYFRFRDNTDGTSGTIALGETDRSGALWCPPYDPNANETLTWWDGTNSDPPLVPSPASGGRRRAAPIASVHGGGAMVGIVDGYVRFLNAQVDPQAFRAFLTIRGGEVHDFPQAGESP